MRMERVLPKLMIPDHYSLESFLHACKNPGKFVYEFRKFRWRLVGSHATAWRFKKRYGAGISVMDRDWDNLVLLDACRYDHFAETDAIGGRLSKAISSGSTSQEFMRTNFCGEDLGDTVYVTSNPHSSNMPDDVFYTIRRTYAATASSGFSGANPSRVTEIAEEAAAEFPDKRLIVHYMQPHAPYLGSYAESLRERLHVEYGLKFDYMMRIRGEGVHKDEDGYIRDLRAAAREGYITNEQLERAHKENLELVLEHVMELVETLDGKTVISSDHGELLGTSESTLYNLTYKERYGHPGNVYVPELRFVPWFEPEYESRRDIVHEEPIGSSHADEDVVEDHLRALGYR